MPAGLLDYFQRHAEHVDLIVVDVFDTLVTRAVEPEHVKRIVSRRVAERYGARIVGTAVYDARQRIERALCEAESQASGELEFRLHDMNARLLAVLREQDPAVFARVDAASFVAAALEIELQVERAVQRCDERVGDFLRTLHGRGVPVVAATDTYLPRAALEAMLEWHGLRRFVAELYVSNEHMASKRSGALYDRLLRERNADPARTLMVGDNPHSDGAQARSRGLNAYLLDRSDVHAANRRFVELHAAPERLATALDACLPGDEPFRELAGVLALFVARLHATLTARDARDVFFLSREGEFLRELFDLYQSQIGCPPSAAGHIRTHYLLVSRRSTFVASLQPLTGETFETLFRQYRRLSAGEFLDSLNIPPDNALRIADELHLDLARVHEDFPTSDALFGLRRCALFQDAYERTRVEQRRLFLAYLSGFGVDTRRGLHLVDVGWKGTIQDHIFRILGSSTPVGGYYLGLTEYAGAGGLNHKHALVFDATRPLGPYDLLFGANRALFEIFLGASHGSAQRYEADATAARAVVQDHAAEQELFHTTIRPWQERVRATFRRLAEVLSVSAYGVGEFETWFARRHFRLAFRPTAGELALFRRLYHFENFGPAGRTSFAARAPVGWRDRLRNARAFLQGPAALLARGWWAPLTLDDLGLSLLAGLYADRMERRYFGRRAAPARALLEHQADQIRDLRTGVDRQSRLISERDNYIKELEKLAVDRYSVMEQQGAVIAERDAEIARLRAEAARRSPDVAASPAALGRDGA